MAPAHFINPQFSQPNQSPSWSSCLQLPTHTCPLPSPPPTIHHSLLPGLSSSPRDSPPLSLAPLLSRFLPNHPPAHPTRTPTHAGHSWLPTSTLPVTTCPLPNYPHLPTRYPLPPAPFIPFQPHRACPPNCPHIWPSLTTGQPTSNLLHCWIPLTPCTLGLHWTLPSTLLPCSFPPVPPPTGLSLPEPSSQPPPTTFPVLINLTGLAPQTTSYTLP